MGANDGATKKSLFIQVRYYDPVELVEHLDHVRAFHRDRSKDDFIYNAVLDEIGDEWGIHPNVAIIRDYLPGGTKVTFDNVFVGSHFIPWTGSGSAYDAGMKDAGHRWANLGIQRALWDQFATGYPFAWHGYINHEGVLDWLDDSWLAACYEAYLIQCRRDLDAVTGTVATRALLWSPAIWSGKPLTSGEEAAISRLFSRVKSFANPGVNWLHFQDMMGRGRTDISQWDVKQWYLELKNASPWSSLGVNMEMFTKDQLGNIVPEEPTVIQAREDWYENQGIPVRSSWEMRYWMPTHKEL